MKFPCLIKVSGTGIESEHTGEYDSENQTVNVSGMSTVTPGTQITVRPGRSCDFKTFDAKVTNVQGPVFTIKITEEAP